MALQNLLRVQRSGKIARYKKELEFLNNGYKDEEDEKRILALSEKIAELEEIQKIASENNTNRNSKSIDKSHNNYISNEVNGVKFNGRNNHRKK